MNLTQTISLRAGGLGSGRHKGDGSMSHTDAQLEARKRWGVAGFARVDNDLEEQHPSKYTVGRRFKVAGEMVEHNLGHGTSFEEAFGRARKMVAGAELDAGGKGSGCNPNAGKCGRHPGAGKNIEEGDRVIIKAPVKVYEEKKGRGGLRVYPVGSEAMVLKIDEKIGTNPQTAVVQPSKYSDPERMKLEDLFLLKKGDVNRPQFDIKDVSKSKVITRTLTQDGAKYTVIKPSTVDDDERGKNKPHGLKGKFTEMTGQMQVYQDPNTRSQIFFAQPKQALQPGDYDKNWGTTVFVYRHYDTKTTVIREYNTGQYGHSFMLSREWEYKNHGAASGFLNKRYGIKQKLPKSL